MIKFKPKWKRDMHELYVKHYGGKEKVEMPVVSDKGKGRCVECGQLRKLGQRGPGKGKCKRCRKEGNDAEK